MKLISITLAHREHSKPMPDWPAEEVPDTDGLLAVHKAAYGDSQPHPSRWTATHIPSGCSLPVPFWSGREVAAWYAYEFYFEARKWGVDLADTHPLEGISKEIRDKLYDVFSRDVPADIGARITGKGECADQ